MGPEEFQSHLDLWRIGIEKISSQVIARFSENERAKIISLWKEQSELEATVSTQLTKREFDNLHEAYSSAKRELGPAYSLYTSLLKLARQ